jgi:hypothetical protein
MAAPPGFHRPLVEPYVRFSLIRLSENILPAASRLVGIVTVRASRASFWPLYPSRGIATPFPSSDNAVQVTALPSGDVILRLHQRYYDGIRLPASSIPFRFLIGIVSCWSFPQPRRGSPKLPWCLSERVASDTPERTLVRVSLSIEPVLLTSPMK